MSMVDERWMGWDGMGWIGNEVESCKIKGCI